METRQSATHAVRASLTRRSRRLAAIVVSAIALLTVFASTAGAHTWNLENEFARSPDGVTAPANPFADSYGNSAAWVVGRGGGGTYTATTPKSYTGLTKFETAASSDWRSPSFWTIAGAEGWIDSAGFSSQFPYVVNNSGSTAAGAWPAETVIAHPAPDTAQELDRGAVGWVSPVTGTVKVNAQFADVDCGGGDGTDYSVDHLVAGSSTFEHLGGVALGFCGSGSFSQEVKVAAGDTLYFSVGDGGSGDHTFDSTSLVLTITDGAAETLSISAPARATATYKHAITPLTVSGKDTDGDAVALSASDVPAGLTFNASTGTLSGAPTVTPGEYVITFLANDGHGETVATHTRLTVEKASCTLTDKPALLAPATSQALSAKLAEVGSKAAIAGREVTFGVESLLGSTVKTSSTGIAKLKTTLPAGGVYLMNTSFYGDAFYNPCGWPNAPSEVLTVEPSTWTATGAGQIAVGKTTATFGLDAAATGEAAEPVLQVITPIGTFTSNDIATLTKPSPTTATWTGSANYGEFEYSITAVDPASGADTVSITFTYPGTPTVAWSSEGAKAVKGGDVKVH